MKLIIITTMLIGAYAGGCKKEADKNAQYLPDLKECYNAATIKTIDSCEYILIPFIGTNVGFTMTHHAACSNKAHTGK